MHRRSAVENVQNREFLVKMPEFDVEGKNLACTLIGIEEDTENNEEEKKAEEESSLA